MTVTFHIEVFWVVTPCNSVLGYEPFRGPCCLHLQGEMKMEASMDLRNDGIVPQHYTVSQLRKDFDFKQDRLLLEWVALKTLEPAPQHHDWTGLT